MQDTQAGRKFRMIDSQVVYRFGKVQPRLYLGGLIHPFYPACFGGVDQYRKVDVIGQRLEILQLAFFLLKILFIVLQGIRQCIRQFLR